ncbi:hypothetical protein CDD81_4478 [Ophiocordyceps australis]|uniref:Uncharacterized protein n=1 Tax=Ophiocordyceps australis TaxID=1399860 RepID=A0A2C5YHI6_9HYPO|nr:hypothetical protein CDD81_4478 [Ophiocordyceps australis]
MTRTRLVEAAGPYVGSIGAVEKPMKLRSWARQLCDALRTHLARHRQQLPPGLEAERLDSNTKLLRMVSSLVSGHVLDDYLRRHDDCRQLVWFLLAAVSPHIAHLGAVYGDAPAKENSQRQLVQAGQATRHHVSSMGYVPDMALFLASEPSQRQVLLANMAIDAVHKLQGATDMDRQVQPGSERPLRRDEFEGAFYVFFCDDLAGRGCDASDSQPVAWPTLKVRIPPPTSRDAASSLRHEAPVHHGYLERYRRGAAAYVARQTNANLAVIPSKTNSRLIIMSSKDGDKDGNALEPMDVDGKTDDDEEQKVQLAKVEEDEDEDEDEDEEELNVMQLESQLFDALMTTGLQPPQPKPTPNTQPNNQALQVTARHRAQRRAALQLSLHDVTSEENLGAILAGLARPLKIKRPRLSHDEATLGRWRSFLDVEAFPHHAADSSTDTVRRNASISAHDVTSNGVWGFDASAAPRPARPAQCPPAVTYAQRDDQPRDFTPGGAEHWLGDLPQQRRAIEAHLKRRLESVPDAQLPSPRRRSCEPLLALPHLVPDAIAISRPQDEANPDPRVGGPASLHRALAKALAAQGSSADPTTAEAVNVAQGPRASLQQNASTSRPKPEPAQSHHQQTRQRHHMTTTCPQLHDFVAVRPPTLDSIGQLCTLLNDMSAKQRLQALVDSASSPGNQHTGVEIPDPPASSSVPDANTQLPSTSGAAQSNSATATTETQHQESSTSTLKRALLAWGKLTCTQENLDLELVKPSPSSPSMAQNNPLDTNESRGDAPSSVTH